MVIIEVEDGGNKTIIARLEQNGFHHAEALDYVDRQSPALPTIEVWIKDELDRCARDTYLDISDLPELEEE